VYDVELMEIGNSTDDIFKKAASLELI